MISFLRAYWRVIGRTIILLLILAGATFLIAHAHFFELFFFALLLIFIASQIFWIGRILDLGERFIPGTPRRAWLAIIAGLVYVLPTATQSGALVTISAPPTAGCRAS